MSEPKVLYGAVGCDTRCGAQNLDDCTTAPFYVTDKPVIIRAFGLGPDDEFVVEQVAGCGDGEYFTPWTNGCGCAYSLSDCTPNIILAVSGRYRLNGCASGPVTAGVYIEMQEVETGATVNIGETSMANCGSQVTATTNPDGSIILVIDGVPTLIPAPSPAVSVIDSGDTLLLTVGGDTYQIDKGPDTAAQIAAALAFVDCSGAAIAPGASLATCADLNGAVSDLNNAISAATADAVNDGDAAGGALTGTYPNPGLNSAAVASALALVDCGGAPVAPGAAVATCSDLNAAVAAGAANAVNDGDAAGGALTGTYPNPGLNPAAVAAALAFVDCDGSPIAASAAMATCTNLTDAITAAIAALPGDKFLQGLAGYNAATNVLTLNMSDATTVDVDLTGLVNDAVASALAGLNYATLADLLTPSVSAGKVVTDDILRQALGSAQDRFVSLRRAGEVMVLESTDSSFFGLRVEAMGGGSFPAILGAMRATGGGSGVQGVNTGGGSGRAVLGIVENAGSGNAVEGAVNGSGNGNGIQGTVGDVAGSTGTGSAVSGFNGPNGTRNAVGTFTQSGANTTWGITTNGAIFTAGGVTTSDKRVKRDITGIDPDRAAEFSRRVVFYTYEKLIDPATLLDVQARRQEEARERFLFLSASKAEALGVSEDALAEQVAAAKAAMTEKLDTSDAALSIGRQAGVIAQELQDLTKEFSEFAFLVRLTDPSNPDSTLVVDYQSLDAIMSAGMQARLAKAGL